MSGIIIELQREALDKNTHVSDLLRKVLLVAKKLKIDEIEAWVLSELNGYENNTNIPQYRQVTGEIKAINPYTGAWMPIMFQESDSETHNSLTRRPAGQAIAQIEALVKEKGQLGMPYPPKLQARLIKAASLLSPPVLLVSDAQFYGILDAVRTTVLEWALKLEERGISGENLSFSEHEQKAASHIVFNIGSMAHSQIQTDPVASHQSMINNNIDLVEAQTFLKDIKASLPAMALKKDLAAELAG